MGREKNKGKKQEGYFVRGVGDEGRPCVIEGSQPVENRNLSRRLANLSLTILVKSTKLRLLFLPDCKLASNTFRLF